MKKATRGMGSVYQRKGSALWWIKMYVNGKVHRESSGATVKKAAVEFLKRRQGEVAGGKFIAKPDALTLDHVGTMLVDDYRANGRKSTACAVYALRHLCSFFGASCPAIHITTDRVTAYTGARFDEGARPATVRNELALLGRALNLAFRAGKLPTLPYIPKPNVQNARTGFYTDEEVERLLTHLPEHARGPFLFSYLSGWRRGEVLGLRWAQVDLRSGTVRLEVGTTKNGEGRLLPFLADPRLEGLLRDQREATTLLEREQSRVIPWVFHFKGERVGSIKTAWERARKAAGLPDRVFHDTRRSCVRNLVQAGVSEKVAMTITGHRTRSIFDRYHIVTTGDQEEALRMVARNRDSRATGTVWAQSAENASAAKKSG